MFAAHQVFINLVQHRLPYARVSFFCIPVGGLHTNILSNGKSRRCYPSHKIRTVNCYTVLSVGQGVGGGFGVPVIACMGQGYFRCQNTAQHNSSVIGKALR